MGAEPVLYVDMDEVLSDFVGGALRVHGIPRNRFELERPRCTWNIGAVLGMTDEQFWAPIYEMGASFWYGLSRTSYFMDVVDMMYRTDLSQWVYVATSPQPHQDCYQGKFRWIQRALGYEFARQRFIMLRDKHRLAKPGAVLIDDSDANVKAFNAAGGYGIVFPTLGNSLYEHASNPVKYVKEQLDARSM